jgi:Uma2 family endonuclease
MRVQVRPTGLYTYPDVSVVCGEPLFDDSRGDILLNPTVLIEVLSPSTEAYDRGEKFAQYRRLDSLQDYVLIAQDTVRVEHYRRRGELWVFSEMNDLDDELQLKSIDCTVPLREIYDKVM